MKLLKFYATWCGPCKMLSRVIEDAADQITLPIEEIDIDQNMEAAMKYGVRGVPTMVIVNDDGSEVARKVGMISEKDLLEFLDV